MDEEKPQDVEIAEAEVAAAPAAATGETRSDALGSLDLVIDVPVRLTVELGSTQMVIREVLQLGKGSVLELDRDASEPADILVNGQLVARGEVTTVDDRLAVRVVEVIAGGPSPGPR